jgi:hypothetical protein
VTTHSTQQVHSGDVETRYSGKMTAQEEARYRAMAEFLGTFPTLSGPPPADLSELGDGVAMFEALSEM